MAIYLRQILVYLLLASCVTSLFAEESPSKLEETPLDVDVVRAFPKLKPRRPVVITNAGDGSNRLFICTQQGVVHWIKNDQAIEQTQEFLDIEKRVAYKDEQNEEGLLGLAFHPDYKNNGELFVYYTSKEDPNTSIISRFRVTKDDPNKANPDSEEEIWRLKQPYWNHNGGTIAFGPDGHLYIGLGDGGAGNDPHGNGQNLGTWFGSILRIDVDNKDEGLGYAIPKDNPFVDREGAKPETWAYGVRNIWRLSFDRKTGDLWAADVGQDKWEEINIIKKGGNYGWNLREGFHKFVPRKGKAPADSVESMPDDLVDPVWEYDHSVGRSITGGHVYRGKQVPELQGKYLYADYVLNKVWALEYDRGKKEVTSVHRFKKVQDVPVITFGEDEQGEIYFSDAFGRMFMFKSAK
jgi:quinoprotein glucose dehydrogenase